MKILIKPLSTNEAWKGRRFKTNKYKSFEEIMLYELKNYKGRRPKKFWAVEFIFGIKNYLKSDIDNFLKASLDCLVKSGIVPDDRFLLEIKATKIKSKEEFIEFRIIEI